MSTIDRNQTRRFNVLTRESPGCMDQSVDYKLRRRIVSHPGKGLSRPPSIKVLNTKLMNQGREASVTY